MQGGMYRARPTPARTRELRARQAHRRRFVLVVSLLALIIVVTAASSHSCAEKARAAPTSTTSASQNPLADLSSATYKAKLQGTIPGSLTDAPLALLVLDYDARSRTLSFVLEVTGELSNPSVAAICWGSMETSGVTVFTLFPGPTVSGSFTGVLARGTVAGEDLVGPLRDGTIADLVHLIENGEAYATIGTSDYPIDAARGQIYLTSPSADEATTS